jgi:hypothetical protein
MAGAAMLKTGPSEEAVNIEHARIGFNGRVKRFLEPSSREWAQLKPDIQPVTKWRKSKHKEV